MSLITAMLRQLSLLRTSGMRRHSMLRRYSSDRRWSDLYSRLMSVEPLEDRTLLSALQILHNQSYVSATPSLDSRFGEFFDGNADFLAVGAWNMDLGGVSKAGQVSVMDAATGAVKYELTEPVPRTNGNFGISISVDGDLLAVGAASPFGAGAVHLFELSSGKFLRTILSPDGGADMFGFSVDLSRGRLLAGAWANSSGGRAWVFDVQTGNVLSTMNNPTPNEGDFFAAQVALDGTSAVISAIYDDTAGQDAGAVYTYDVSTSGSLDPIFTIQNPKPSNTEAGDRFGVSVSVSGDNLVIGDWMDDTNGIDAGTAYVYSVTRGVLKKTLVDPIKKVGNNFGARVGIRDNIVVVGIRGADRKYIDSGAAAVFDVITGELIKIIDNPTPGDHQDFSSSAIRILDDAILIGSPQYKSFIDGQQATVDRFAVREITVITSTTIDPNPGLSLVDETPESDSAFGSFFETNGALTAVGAWKATVNGMAKAGSVSVFDAVTGEIAYELTEPTPRTEGNYGVHIAVDGDLLAVGAASPTQQGKVYLYKLSTGELLKTISSPDGGNDMFGYALDLAAGRLLVGALKNSSGGRAWIFDVSTGVIRATINNPSGKADDYFAAGVALDGGKAIVPAIYDDTAGLDAGSVYVFDATATGTLTPQQSIRNPRPSNVKTGDRFGVSVAISGSHLVIGDWMNDENGVESGAAYLYDANTGEQNHFFDDPSPGLRNNFGNVVSILGNRVAVGIRGSASGGQGGAVAIYDLRSGDLISTIHNPTPVTADEFGSTGIQLMPGRILVGSVQKRSMIPQALGAVDVFEIDTTTEVFGTDDRDTFAVSFPTGSQGTMNLKISSPDAGFFDLGNFPVEERLKLSGKSGADVVKVYGTKGADRFQVEGGHLEANGFGISLDSIETQTLIGDAGNDTYAFDADLSIGTVSYDESGGGIDTFDFSKTTTIGIDLDLSKPTQDVVSARLKLKRVGVDGIENIYGSAVNDQLWGNSLDNRIFGLNGNDKINGAAGNDTLAGGSGHDTYVFATAVGIESDVITEVVNGGVDTLDFGAVTRSLTLDLGRSDLQSIESGRRLTVTNAQVENARGGQGNDVIRGNQFANQLFGNQGNDTLDGLDGDDRLSGGIGSDTVNGGNGADTYVFENSVTLETDVVTEPLTSVADLDFLDFSEITNDLLMNLGSTGMQLVHKNRNLRLNSSTQFEGVRGGSGNDTLIGNSASYNVLSGGSGNDTLNGGSGGGDDNLIGGNGDDSYLFGNPVGAEFDSVNEVNTSGIDTIDFSRSTQPVTLDISTEGPRLVQPGRTLSLNGGLAIIENVYGGSGNDTLIGNSASYNVLSGGSGNDTLNGGSGGGDDNLIGGNGDDSYLFGNPVGAEFDSVNEVNTSGIDTIDFSRSTQPVTLDISTGAICVMRCDNGRKRSM